MLRRTAWKCVRFRRSSTLSAISQSAASYLRKPASYFERTTTVNTPPPTTATTTTGGVMLTNNSHALPQPTENMVGEDVIHAEVEEEDALHAVISVVFIFFFLFIL